MPKSVFMYCRRSSEGEDRQILSIPSQIKELKQVANKLDLKIIDTFEESKTAKAPGREKFAEMMVRINKNEVDGILCWKLDRLARNPVDGGAIMWAVKDKKIEIITASQTYSHINENDLLMAVEFGMAQKFIDDLGKNSQRGMKTKAEMGWYPAPAPIGYKNTPSRKKGFKVIIKDKNKFPIVRKMFDLILAGKHACLVYKIVSNDWKLSVRPGKILAQSSFYRILNSSFYYGDYEWPAKSDTWYHGKHQPLITKNEFDLVQKMLGRRGKPIARKHVFDLTGLIACQKCGFGITATKKTKYYKRTNNTATYTYYHCTHRNRKIPCNSKPLKEKELFDQINALLLTVKPDEEFIKWAKRWLAVLHGHESSTQENILKSQQEALQSVENKLNRLLDMRLNDQLDDPTYQAKKKTLETEKRDISRRLKGTGENLDNWRGKVENALDFAYACQSKFAHGTRDDRQEVLFRIGENLLLNTDKKINFTLKREYGVLADRQNWPTKYKDWLEPQEYTDILSQTPSLRPAIPVWLRGQDSNL